MIDLIEEPIREMVKMFRGNSWGEERIDQTPKTAKVLTTSCRSLHAGLPLLS
jgi:hypothetical protein